MIFIKDVFSRVYIWSPSIEVDNIHGSQLKIISETTSNLMTEKTYVDSYDPSELEQVINTRQKVINYQKKKT